MAWTALLGGMLGDTGGGGTSSASTAPVTVGGLGSQQFDFSNRAFSTTTQGVPSWALIAGAAVVALLVFRK